MNDHRIAILGAGGVGVCAALELATRGHRVDLYDENTDAVTRATANNEGKIHLGLVYARDTSLMTARTMIQGAVHFIACLKRWIDIDADDVSTSTPFYYAVHNGSMTGTDELAGHYDQCRRLLEDACSATGLSYLDRDRTLLAERVPRAQLETLVAGEYFAGAFRTSERAINPRAIADRLRRAVHANPRIRFIGHAEVASASWAGPGRIQISFRLDGDLQTEAYDQVANTLWHGRLAVDASLGVTPPQEWIYRYKLGAWIRTPVETSAVPSLTMVLGPFGDVVNFGEAGLYFSWYPTGMVGRSADLVPPDWDRTLSCDDRQAVARRSYEALLLRCPSLESVRSADGAVETIGGVICAWGKSDIDVADSRLHTRHEIGVHSVRNYHSVNTGKYTMVPYLGLKTAERMLGLS